MNKNFHRTILLKAVSYSIIKQIGR